jgi:DNA-binding transcriptional ArsR family regulator
LNKWMPGHKFTSNYLYIMKARRDVYQAIADPTRRAIIHMIAAQPHNIKSITEKFEMSQQAISLHLKILEDCGLITIRQQGRQRYCEARLDQLEEVAAWVTQYRQFWEQKLSHHYSFAESQL